MSSNWAVFVRLFTHREGGVRLSRTMSRKILLERSEKNILYFFINGIFFSLPQVSIRHQTNFITSQFLIVCEGRQFCKTFTKTHCDLLRYWAVKIQYFIEVSICLISHSLYMVNLKPINYISEFSGVKSYGFSCSPKCLFIQDEEGSPCT